jgi:hypothetical protein
MSNKQKLHSFHIREIEKTVLKEPIKAKIGKSEHRSQKNGKNNVIIIRYTIVRLQEK